MANTSSAKKAAKQNEKKRLVNLARRSAIKTAVKKFITVVDEKNTDFAKAQELLRDVASKLGRARGKSLIHQNTAARKLSRLTKRLNKKMQTAA